MRALVCMVLCLVAAPAWCVQGDSQARLLFDEATKAFQAGLAADGDAETAHFRTAAAAYETLIRDHGIRNGALYFDAGNCYLHLDELGKAILSYRLAQRTMPGSLELQANLDVALRRRVDHIAAREHVVLGLPVGSMGRGLSAWLMRLPAKLPVLMVAFTLVWVVLGARLLRRSTALNVLLALAVICSVVYGTSVATYAGECRGGRHGVVLDKQISPRTGPSELHPESFEQPLHEGTEFRILRQEAGWCNVELPDGARCWLPAKAVGTY